MKKQFYTALVVLFTGIVVLLSCKKEKSCEGSFNCNKPPIAVAGPDQVITLPTDSISLDGSASNDPDGTISEWLWKKISGPASFNIVNTTTAKTIVRNLDTGVYKFELKVSDDKNLSAIDTVQITVTDRISTNRPPVAEAGGNQTITLPTNSVNLDGSASSDPDNNITAYAWTKISGPSSFNITNTNATQTQVTNLAEGFYQFELKVTDAGGLIATDTMQVTVNIQVMETNVDVYVAGSEENSGGIGVATYWKNGQAVSLTNGTNNARGIAIAVVGSNVYVAGDEDYGGNGRVLKYWKNGVAFPLTDGSKRGFVFSIAVSGNDVYVSGMEEDGDTYYSYETDDWGNVIDSSLIHHSVAKYWKNGQEIRLTDGTNNAEAWSIAVVGSDVYVAGSESVGSLSFGMPPFVAKYWKNGQEVPLTNGTTLAHAMSIAIAGSDVYVAGSEYNCSVYLGCVHEAKYWKNGVPVSLTNGSNYSDALSIAVVGNDVYVAGLEYNNSQQPNAKYWKNGQAITLSQSFSGARSIAVSGSNVYVAGYILSLSGGGREGVLWKNGQEVLLSPGSNDSFANSIVVVQH